MVETLRRKQNILSYYEEYKEDIITQLKSDLDPEHIPESNIDIENYYKPILLEIASDWYDQTLTDLQLPNASQTQKTERRHKNK